MKEIHRYTNTTHKSSQSNLLVIYMCVPDVINCLYDFEGIIYIYITQQCKIITTTTKSNPHNHPYLTIIQNQRQQIWFRHKPILYITTFITNLHRFIPILGIRPRLPSGRKSLHQCVCLTDGFEFNRLYNLTEGIYVFDFDTLSYV